jgi:hypothetical protein
MLETKKIIRDALESNDFEALVRSAMQNRQVMSLLVRLAYEKDTLVGWRAILAVGHVARALAGTDHDFLRVTVQKLLWTLSDESGGIGWSAPELLGEIVSADPSGFADIVPLIAEVFDLEERTFRSGVLYALSRIAETCPEMATGYQAILEGALMDEDPLTNVYGLDLISRVWPYISKEQIWDDIYNERILSAIRNLRTSSKVVWIYKNDSFIDMVVGELSENVLKNMSNG